MKEHKREIKGVGPIEKSFGRILKQLRLERGLSQEELGFRSGFHRTYISHLERGLKSPSLRTIFQLSETLEVVPSQMISNVQILLKMSPRKTQSDIQVRV